MTREEQIQLVIELTDSVREEIIQKIREEIVPADWTGIELRLYLADKFQDSVHIRTPRATREAYKDAVLRAPRLCDERTNRVHHVIAGDWPFCHCGKRAVYVLGQEHEPACEEGLVFWRNYGDRRIAKTLVLQPEPPTWKDCK